MRLKSQECPLGLPSFSLWFPEMLLESQPLPPSPRTPTMAQIAQGLTRLCPAGSWSPGLVPMLGHESGPASGPWAFREPGRPSVACHPEHGGHGP